METTSGRDKRNSSNHATADAAVAVTNRSVK